MYEMIVADTHIIIWNALKPEKLSEKAKDAIFRANQRNGIIFCEISLWEIAMLMKKQRIQVNSSYKEFIRLLFEANNYILQGITPEIAEVSIQFDSNVGNDPADRIIAATSLVKNTPLLTADKNLRKAKAITTIW